MNNRQAKWLAPAADGRPLSRPYDTHWAPMLAVEHHQWIHTLCRDIYQSMADGM